MTPGLPLPLRHEILSDEQVLERHGEAWSALLACDDGHQMASSPLWLGTWWRIFGKLGGRRLRFALFWSGTRLVGLAPLVWRWRMGRVGLPFRRLELLGTGEPEEHEIATDYGGLLAAPGFHSAVAAAFARTLDSASFGNWDELSLRSLDASTPMVSCLSQALVDRGMAVVPTPLSGAPYIPLPRTFDDYLAALPGSSRYFVRRSLRDFDTFSQGRAEIRRARTLEELAEGQKVLFASHAERWQNEGRRGVFASALFSTFHQRLMPELLQRGQLDLRWLVVDGRPLAALYNYVYAGRVHFYQGGRVLDLPKHLRPGIVLHASAIRDAIDAGHREYDFLAGTSRYKQQLSLAVRPMTDLTIERPGVRRSLTRAAQSWKTWAGAFPLWMASDPNLPALFDSCSGL